MSKQFIQQTTAISTEKRDQNRIYTTMQYSSSNLWRKQCNTAAAQTRAMSKQFIQQCSTAATTSNAAQQQQSLEKETENRQI
jgi:hypothetical protein